jgi:hypothetical protein
MRLLEQQLIQLRGFRNAKIADNVIGFQVPIRLTYYRGVWASQLRAATVTVNDEVYANEQIFWTIDGNTIEQSELAITTDVHWNSMNAAILTVRKEGGLAPGIYDVKVSYDFSSSYLPPAIDTGYFETKGERKMVLVR